MNQNAEGQSYTYPNSWSNINSSIVFGAFTSVVIFLMQLFVNKLSIEKSLPFTSVTASDAEKFQLHRWRLTLKSLTARGEPALTG